MKDTDKIDGLRTEYLAAMAELSGWAVDRTSHLPGDMGMNANRSPQDTEESNKAVLKINRQIAEVCNRARAIEQRSRGTIGAPTLFDSDVPNAIRVALSILVGKSFSGSWQHECRYVDNGSGSQRIGVTSPYSDLSGSRLHILQLDVAKGMSEVLVMQRG